MSQCFCVAIHRRLWLFYFSEAVLCPHHLNDLNRFNTLCAPRQGAGGVSVHTRQRSDRQLPG